jgi:hypothetical protein
MGQQTFLEAMKELFAPPPVAPEPTQITTPPHSPGPPPRGERGEEESSGPPSLLCGRGGGGGEGAVVVAAVRFLEALAVAMDSGEVRVTDDPRTGKPALLVPLPAELLQRGAAAMQQLAQRAARRPDAERQDED